MFLTIKRIKINKNLFWRFLAINSNWRQCNKWVLWKLFSVLLLTFRWVRIIILALSSRVLTCFYFQGSLGNVYTCGDFWSMNIKARSQGMMEVSQINIVLKEKNIWKKKTTWVLDDWKKKEFSLDKHLHWMF